MTDSTKERLTANLRSLDDILMANGDRDKIVLQGVKQGLALKLEQAMREQQLTKLEMARRMGTSRAQLDRVLDPAASNMTLDTIERAARSVGKRLHLELL